MMQKRMVNTAAANMHFGGQIHPMQAGAVFTPLQVPMNVPGFTPVVVNAPMQPQSPTMDSPVVYQYTAQPVSRVHPLNAPESGTMNANSPLIPLVLTPNGFPQFFPNMQFQMGSPEAMMVHPTQMVMSPTPVYPNVQVVPQSGNVSPSGSVSSYSKSRSSSPKAVRSPPGFEPSAPPKRQKTSLEYAFEAKARASAKNNRARRRAMQQNGWVPRPPSAPGQGPKVKHYGFRSKQNMIDKVYDLLIRKYTAMGILAPDEEVLRGETTIRLHVKKYKALISIEAALESVEAVDKVTIKRISIPLSMKNEFQKKGFLVYVQVSDIKEVPIAQSVLRQFEVFRKCEVAPQTAEFAKSNVKKSPTPTVSNNQSQARKESSSQKILFEEEAIVVPASVFPRAKAGY